MIKYRSELYQLLPENSIVVELGCAEGLFSSDILKWPNVSKLYMVDAWQTIPNQFGDGASEQVWHDKNYSAAMLRVNFAIEKVKVLRGISWDMAKNVEDESLDLLYLDACHSYGCVMNDLKAWAPKVKSGGIIAGHDYLMPQYGVFQAVATFTEGKYAISTISENKSEDAGFWFRKI